MSSVPAVSVVMPVYNARRYLASAVESVLAQTFKDFEFILVDDGSKDDSLTILRGYESRDPRIRIISRPNTGIVGALNDGLAAAQADLIARMDSDDLCEPQRFEKQVAFLSGHPNHVLVGSQVLLIDPEDAALCLKRDTEYTHEKIDWAHLHHRWPLVHPTVMMRRSAVESVGRYRTKYQWLEDLDLFLRLAELGRLASLEEPLLRYRLHTGSVCHTHEKEQDAIRPDLYAEVYARRGVPPPALTQDGKTPEVPHNAALSSTQRHRLWAWWALMGGNLSTARKYALRTFRSAPFATESWRIMYCALRGY